MSALPPARRRLNVLECARCGNQELERRTGWFRDEDYRELLREYFEMERLWRRAEARLHHQKGETAWWKEQAQWELDHLIAITAILVAK